MPEGNSLPGNYTPRLTGLAAATSPFAGLPLAPVLSTPAAPAPSRPQENATLADPTTTAIDWKKLGILALVAGAVVFVVAGRKKKRR